MKDRVAGEKLKEGQEGGGGRSRGGGGYGRRAKGGAGGRGAEGGAGR